jgi:hypothetical protein
MSLYFDTNDGTKYTENDFGIRYRCYASIIKSEKFFLK